MQQPAERTKPNPRIHSPAGLTSLHADGVQQAGAAGRWSFEDAMLASIPRQCWKVRSSHLLGGLGLKHLTVPQMPTTVHVQCLLCSCLIMIQRKPPPKMTKSRTHYTPEQRQGPIDSNCPLHPAALEGATYSLPTSGHFTR